VALLGTMPWLGTKFDEAAQRGTNSVNRTAVVLTRLLAPTYRMRRTGDHCEGFDVLEAANPFPIKRNRNEAVQLVPGTNLGAKRWRQADR